MCGKPGEEPAGLLGLETQAADAGCRLNSDDTESRQRQGVSLRQGERRQDVVGEIETGPDERTEEVSVGAAVGAETVSGLGERAVEQGGTATIERMRQRHLGLHPLQSMFAQRHCPERW